MSGGRPLRRHLAHHRQRDHVHDEDVRPVGLQELAALVGHDDADLRRELDRMTDHRTLALFSDPSSEAVVVRSPVSRLVVDVERFSNDIDEPMAARGMGAVYAATSHLTPIRLPRADDERERLIQA